MTIQEALKKNGKAETQYKEGKYAKVGVNGILYWHDTETDCCLLPVEYSHAVSSLWLPCKKRKEKCEACRLRAEYNKFIEPLMPGENVIDRVTNFLLSKECTCTKEV